MPGGRADHYIITHSQYSLCSLSEYLYCANHADVKITDLLNKNCQNSKPSSYSFGTKNVTLITVTKLGTLH